MKAKDIKTLITSSTIIIAVALYLIFGPEPPTEEEYEEQQAAEQQQEDGTADSSNVSEAPASEEPSVAIPLAEAEAATGKTAQEIDYISANDGDTFNVNVNGQKERVRLLMVDTPEMNYNKGEPMPYAEEAKAFTDNLLTNANKIELLFDKGPETDNYDRLLAYVYVDGVLLQEALLKEGFAAMRYVNPPNDSLEDELREIQKQAEQADVNVWSIDGYFENNRFNENVK